MKNLIGALVLFCAASQLHAAWLVDNAETGANTNSRGGNWVKFDDGFSTTVFTPDVSPGHSGTYCRLFQWTIKTGSASPFAGAISSLNAGWNGEDLHTFYGIRFYARGTGRYDISLATDRTRSGNNHYVKSVNLTSEWTLYEMPFSQFAQTWGQSQPWDPSSIYGVGVAPVATFGMSGQIWVDDIEFYRESEGHQVPDPNVILLPPKVNQVGYLPDGEKHFCIVSNSAAAGDTFHLIDSAGAIRYSGALTGISRNDVEATGEHVWKVDFSGFQSPGRYRVEVNGRTSYPFTISDSVYNDLFRDALRCFYLIRCGIAENDPVSGINRPACHLADAKVRGGTGTVDAIGGWHNAGDKGKFVNETAISIASMLWLYELKTASLQDVNTQIPESGNGVTDLLDEAKWGLQWLLKMQKPDGSVYHKADSEPNLLSCPDMPLESDPYTDLRYVEFQKSDAPQVPSTIDAADFVGVMSQAARVFHGIDTAFSSRCLAAATRSWSWVTVHRSVGQTDPYYTDSVAVQEFLWAEGEMARTLGSSELRSLFSPDIVPVALGPVGWADPQLVGYLALYFDSRSEATLKNKIRNKTVDLCNTFVDVTNTSGYGVALRSWEYWWESNELVLSRAGCLLAGYEMTANGAYKDAARAQLDYILGLNSLNKSFVMGYGTNAMEHPYNCVYAAYLKPMPGWAAGGANSSIGGADFFLADLIRAGTPKAKCYVDKAECGLGSWASNEGETSENAALVFLSGYFHKGSQSVLHVVDSHPVVAPMEFLLHHNFPNPFNPSTTIRYTIPHRSHVNLIVYNTLGQQVAELVNGEVEGGYHEVKFDAGSLASGVYFYRIQAGNFIQVRKLV
ncbi:T9SS C-terminal target domain-containing protein, partial [bacterium]